MLLIHDAEAQVLPPIRGTNDIDVNASGIAVPVLHSQDVDNSEDFPQDEEIPEAKVLVVCRIDEPPPGHGAFETAIDCGSGTLTLGDADEEHEIPVGPGRLRVHIRREPTEHATHVTVWLNPA